MLRPPVPMSWWLLSIRLLGCIMALLGLNACTPSQRTPSNAKEQMARRYLDRFAAGDATLLPELDASLRTDAARAELQKTRQLFPSGPPTVVDLVGYHVSHSASGETYNLTYQFGYGPKWILAHAAWVERPPAPPLIIGLGARGLSKPLQEKHALTFDDAGKRHYVFVLAAVLNPLFCLGTLIASFRGTWERHRWLWRVLICLGFVGFTLNWTEGNITLEPFSIGLFGVTLMRASVYSPWIVAITIPFGAILFWIKRGRAAMSAH
jgi:hypothetical protein